MNRSPFLPICGLLMLMACGPKPSGEETAVQDSDLEIAEECPESEKLAEPAGFAIRDPYDEEINEFGVVTILEDAGYPMYNVTISFPERGSTSDFILNVESAALSHDVNDFQDKYATFFYESESSNEVLDIIYDGKSLLGAYAPADHEGLVSFEGTLKGALSESGDLPSDLQVEGPSGTLDFKYFVDDAVVNVNNKQVTVYYYQRFVDTITYMELSTN